MHGSIDTERAKPSWGWLYALATLMLTLLAVADVYVPAGVWRRALEVVIAVSAFATMQLWVRANRRALDLIGARNPGFREIVETPKPADIEARRRSVTAPSAAASQPWRVEPTGTASRPSGRRQAVS